MEPAVDTKFWMLAFLLIGMENLVTNGQEPPSPPFNLAVANIEARSALLQFMKGSEGSSPISHWIVEALEGENATIYREIYNSSDTSTMTVQVENLSPYTTYQLRLIAGNAYGRSDPSSPTRDFMTLKAVPEIAPRDVTVTSVSATAFRVSWLPLSELEWNGEQRGYKVDYKMSDANFNMITPVIPKDNKVIYKDIDGLHEGLQYQVKVSAFNDVGDGPSSPIITKTAKKPSRKSVATFAYEKEGTKQCLKTIKTFAYKNEMNQKQPTPPLHLAVTNIQARSAVLHFMKRSEGSSPISHLIVEALEGENATTYKQIYNSSDTSTMTVQVENLSPYTTYQLRLIAENAYGRSDPSSPTRDFMTLKAIPEIAPRDVTVTSLGATALRVSWLPLSDLEWNGEPKGYKVYNKISNSNDTTIIPKDSLATQCDIVGIKEGVQYQVKMLAFNDVGDGPLSHIITRTTTSDAVSQNNLIGNVVRSTIAVIFTRAISLRLYSK